VDFLFISLYDGVFCVVDFFFHLSCFGVVVDFTLLRFGCCDFLYFWVLIYTFFFNVFFFFRFSTPVLSVIPPPFSTFDVCRHSMSVCV